MSHPNIITRLVAERPTPPLDRSPRPLEGTTFKTLLTLAALQVCTGGLFLALQALSSVAVAYRAAAGAIILAAAVVQGKLVLKALKAKRNAPRAKAFRHGAFWKSLFVGVVLSYLLAMVLGPSPGAPYVFAAGVSVSYTLLLLPITANSQVLETWKRLAQKRLPRRASVAVYLCLLLTVGAELSLRSYAWLSQKSWLGGMLTASPKQAFTTAGIIGGIPTLAYDGDSRFHVAVVGDEVTLGGIHNDGALSQLEVMVPGVRVTNFSVPQAGPREYATDLADRVTRCRPNLVLTFVSVGDDILAETAGSELFDWRSLELSRFARSLIGNWAKRQPPNSPEVTDQNQFLRSIGRELTVCRTPIDAATERRWKKAFSHLDALVRACQQSQIEVALVVVPSEFQVNTVLLETLRRRAGYEPKDLDLDLPQRRLANFAVDHQLPCVDLLPHMRLCDESPFERYHRQWNAEGTAVALRTVGGWLQNRYGDTLSATGQVSKQ